MLTQFRPAGTCRLILVLVALLAAFAGVQAAQAQSGTCKSSSNSGYTVTVCISTPASGATVSGLTTVTATASVSGSSSGIGKLLFSLDGQYLLTDFQSPYTFQLPTTNFANGSHTLSVVASMRDGFPERRPRRDAQLLQRHHPARRDPPSLRSHPGRAPAGQSLIMSAVGDGAGGETNAGLVTPDDRRLEP